MSYTHNNSNNYMKFNNNVNSLERKLKNNEL